MAAKLALYRFAKKLGLFAAARRLTRNKLRILAYHGAELRDESGFMPGVFMKAETFAARLESLRRGGYPVLPLGEAVQRLKAGTLPECAVAITIDDGFHSTAAVAKPLLERANLPATLYVTTYYTQRDVPVFRLAMQYCFWRTLVRSVELAQLGCGVQGTAAVDAELLWELINHGEQNLDEPARAELLRLTAGALRVDLAPMVRDRALHLMTEDELRESTLDLQLHTHRHRLPLDPVRARGEIEENRKVLSRTARGPLLHFCYPSGYWSSGLFPMLEAAGVATATTCERGLNDRATHPYALKRFLDANDLPLIVFEAELSGFAELLRSLRRLLRADAPTVQVGEEERRRGYPAGHGRTILERVRRVEQVA